MDFRPDPPRPFEDLKNPLRSGLCSARIPERTRGIWPKIHNKKSEFCIYFFPVSCYFKYCLYTTSKLKTEKHTNFQLSIINTQCETKQFNKSEPFLTNTMRDSNVFDNYYTVVIYLKQH